MSCVVGHPVVSTHWWPGEKLTPELGMKWVHLSQLTSIDPLSVCISVKQSPCLVENSLMFNRVSFSPPGFHPE